MNMRRSQIAELRGQKAHLLGRKLKLIQQMIDYLLKRLNEPLFESIQFELDQFSSDTDLFLDVIYFSMYGAKYTESIVYNIELAIKGIELPNYFEFESKEVKNEVRERIKNSLITVKALLPIHFAEIKMLCDREEQLQLEQMQGYSGSGLFGKRPS